MGSFVGSLCFRRRRDEAGAEVGVSFLKSRSPRRKTISPALRRRRSSGTSSLRRACCFGVRSSETDISRPRRDLHDLRTLNLSAGELSLIKAGSPHS